MKTKEYYSIKAAEFSQISDIKFKFLDSYHELCKVVAREIVDLIVKNSNKGKLTKLILPVGPINVTYIADLCNKEGVSCESLVIFAMDEYLGPDGEVIPEDHPLSFRAFFKRGLIDRLDMGKKIPEDQLILPNPSNLSQINEKIREYGGIDITYGGLGINGHIAFNSPPTQKMSVDAFRAMSARIVELREGDIIQFAMAGTLGNIEIIPEKACTLGPEELFSAKEIRLTFMRSWHAGVMRRALFGPISTNCPGSLVQNHPNVLAYVTPEARTVPSIDLLMRPPIDE